MQGEYKGGNWVLAYISLGANRCGILTIDAYFINSQKYTVRFPLRMNNEAITE